MSDLASRVRARTFREEMEIRTVACDEHTHAAWHFERRIRTALGAGALELSVGKLTWFRSSSRLHVCRGGHWLSCRSTLPGVGLAPSSWETVARSSGEEGRCPRNVEGGHPHVPKGPEVVVCRTF